MVIKGYHIDEIEQAATELESTIQEMDVDSKLALLALCRCIVKVGDPEDLDLACVMIDRFSEEI